VNYRAAAPVSAPWNSTSTVDSRNESDLNRPGGLIEDRPELQP
jgi:hypothetical protein